MCKEHIWHLQIVLFCCALIFSDSYIHDLQLVVSDHGMTDSGNHGGSSYEETDSLALFIGPKFEAHNQALTTQNTANQVKNSIKICDRFKCCCLFGDGCNSGNINELVTVH